MGTNFETCIFLFTLQLSSLTLKWMHLVLLESFLARSSLQHPILHLASNIYLGSLFDSWQLFHKNLNIFAPEYLYCYFFQIDELNYYIINCNSEVFVHQLHKQTDRSVIEKQLIWLWYSCYLSLFCLDFSRSSLSTVDDLNLLSSSAYFFWLFSAKSSKGCRNEYCWGRNVIEKC